jgi:transposase
LNNPLSIFLPEDLLNHFDLIKVTELGEVSSKQMIYQLELVEKNDLPKGYTKSDYESKGFYPSKTIQDFPIRGKAVYLDIKRRRWRDKQTGKEIKSDYSFIAEGSKITEELSDFLKDTNKYPRRYH